MAELLIRSFAATLELGEDGRTMFGRVVPYNVAADVADDDRSPRYREQFAPGAFRRSITERGDRVRLYAGHPVESYEAMPVGRAAAWDDRADALYATFRLADTGAARDAGSLVRDGLVTGLSVGFDPVPDRTKRAADGTVVRLEARLHHVALVARSAYAGAEVLALRAHPGAPMLGRRALALRLALLLEEEDHA
jgi:HK97 family phage prohead protease